MAQASTISAVPIVAGIVLGLLTALFAPVYVRLLRREVSRPERLGGVAAELGLAFSRGDPAYPGNTALRLPFELFSRGSRQTCENFMRGAVDGVEITAFDLLYVQVVERTAGATESEPVRYTCALAAIGGDRPHVVIEPVAEASVERSEHVRLEWNDFNARYRVRSPDRGYAPELLDVGVMAWLVDSAPRLPLVWEVQRDRLLCRAPDLPPERWPEMIHAVAALARLIRAGS